MKHWVTVFSFVFLLSATGCTAPTKTINGVEYRDYGVLDQTQEYNPNIRYEPNWWNIVVAVVFFELLFIPPIYVFGFHLMKPVGVKETSSPQR